MWREIVIIKHHSKRIATIIILFVIYVYGGQYYADIIGKRYFKNFLTDQFEKVETKITNCFSAEESIIIEINEQEHIKYFRDILKNQIKHGYIKERKVYYYNIQLKFYEMYSMDTYVFDIFLDDDYISLRPVFLRKRGKNAWMGGYSFVMDDLNFIFYNKILQMIKTH